jgi:hypothetical protein
LAVTAAPIIVTARRYLNFMACFPLVLLRRGGGFQFAAQPLQ